jgi:hypothetical protein
MTMITELPTFGSEFGRKEWSFEAGWLNVNHGSYGAAPNSVISAFRKVSLILAVPLGRSSSVKGRGMNYFGGGDGILIL